MLAWRLSPSSRLVTSEGWIYRWNGVRDRSKVRLVRVMRESGAERDLETVIVRHHKRTRLSPSTVVSLPQGADGRSVLIIEGNTAFERVLPATSEPAACPTPAAPILEAAVT